MLVLEYEHANEVIFERIAAPSRARLGQTANIKLVLRSKGQASGRVTLKMTDATIAQALDVITGATGLEFIRSPEGLRVRASEELKQPPVRPAEPERARSPFFVKMSLPGPDGSAIEVFLRAEELPPDIVEAILAEKAKLIERLRAVYGKKPPVAGEAGEKTASSQPAVTSKQ